jgi:hypothetical protein
MVECVHLRLHSSIARFWATWLLHSSCHESGCVQKQESAHTHVRTCHTNKKTKSKQCAVCARCLTHPCTQRPVRHARGHGRVRGACSCRGVARHARVRCVRRRRLLSGCGSFRYCACILLHVDENASSVSLFLLHLFVHVNVMCEHRAKLSSSIQTRLRGDMFPAAAQGCGLSAATRWGSLDATPTALMTRSQAS